MKITSFKSILVLMVGLSMAPVARAQEFRAWSSPVNAGMVVNSPCNDQHPALSKDGLSLVFASNRALTAGTPCVAALHLWVSQRDSLDSPWQTPQPLTQLNSAYNSPYEDNAPNFSTDGHWLFFHSQRPSDCVVAGGIRQLWAARRRDKRDDFGWETPVNLGCTLNGPTDDAGPTFFEGNGALYLYFTRDLMSPAQDPSGNGFDVHVSTCPCDDLSRCNREQLWDAGVNVEELNSPVRDTRTAIRRRDGLEMIISTARSITVGGLDLWVSTRTSQEDPWSIPVNLNEDNLAKGGESLVNAAANEGAPALSWDGQTLFFYSNRAGGSGANDLYVSTRAKEKP